jgi:tRNA U54 and U55 pseudouridine synthase Pus10
LLQLLARRRLAGAHRPLDLAFCRRVPHRLMARRHPLQPEVVLDLPHDAFLAPPVLAVAGDAAVVPDAARNDVDVLVLGVGVARHDVLVRVQPHARQIPLADVSPLHVAQLLPRSRR